MPGVIGASIFSPRPARGYRFHSLQVEIILTPRKLQRPQSFSLNFRFGGGSLCRNLNVLPRNSFPEFVTEPAYPGCHLWPPIFHSPSPPSSPNFRFCPPTPPKLPPFP